MGKFVGPGSQFAAMCSCSKITDNNDGTFTATFDCYIAVQSGSSGFQGTNITTNWSAGTVAVYNSDTGHGTATVKSSYGRSASFTARASYTGGSGTVYESIDTQTSEAYNPVYTIDYDANGGSGAPASQTKKKGESITLSTTIPIKDGYKFVGWSRAVGYQAWYQPGDVYDEDVSRTLYAVWEKKYTLSLDPNGGNNSNPKVTVVSNQSDNSTLPEASLSTRNNCEFLGYFTEEVGGNQIYDSLGVNTNDGVYWSNNEYVYDNNAILYAHWKFLNTVYYKKNDEYKLCYTYVKENDAYVPKVMYIKIDGVYKRNGVPD